MFVLRREGSIESEGATPASAASADGPETSLLDTQQKLGKLGKRLDLLFPFTWVLTSWVCFIARTGI